MGTPDASLSLKKHAGLGYLVTLNYEDASVSVCGPELTIELLSLYPALLSTSEICSW